VTVNLSSIQFANGDAYKTVKKALDETGLQSVPERLAHADRQLPAKKPH
jgi:hypothetical protein